MRKTILGVFTMSKKLKFHYIYEDNYSPDHISGINSSISPRDELELNFFLERNALPKSETYTLEEDGTLSGLPIKMSPENYNEQINIVRHIKNGIILDVEGVKLLQEHLDNYLSMVNSKKEL